MAVTTYSGAEQYNFDVVKKFAVMSLVWAVIGMSVGVYIASELAWPFLNFRQPVFLVRTLPPGTHHLGDFRIRRLGAVCHLLLRRPAHLPEPPDFGRHGQLHFLGLDGDCRAGRHQLRAGLHPVARIRGNGMADRHPDRGGVGDLPDPVRRHHHAAQAAAHLRCQLVLPILHPGDRAAAYLQQPGDAHRPVLDEVLQPVCRHPGRDDAVVVWPQRGGVLPHCRLPRHDVLLRTKTGRPPDLLLPPVDRALLGAGLYVHVGGRAPPALDGAAGLDLDRWPPPSPSCF